MTHLKSFIKKESGEKEYKLDDMDHPNGWEWKEIEMLLGMGFEPEGDARMVLKVRHHDGMNDVTYKIYKTDDDFVLLIDDRKHLFKTFNDMLNKIDELGSIEI